MVLRAFLRARLTSSPVQRIRLFRRLLSAEDLPSLHHQLITVCDIDRDDVSVAVLVDNLFHEFDKVFSGCCPSVFGEIG